MFGRLIVLRFSLCILVGFEVRWIQATAAKSVPAPTVTTVTAYLPVVTTGPGAGLPPVQAEAIFWEAPRKELNFKERLGSGLGSSSSSGLVPGPGPAAPIHKGGPAAGGAVSWSSSAGEGGEPPSRPSTQWDDPHFRPHFDNSTDRNVTAQLGRSAFLRCRIAQLGDRTEEGHDRSTYPVMRINEEDSSAITVVLEDHSFEVTDIVAGAALVLALHGVHDLSYRQKASQSLAVSWVRQRDLQILTVGTYTYTSDQRFHSIHLEGSEDWTLEVRYTQKGDAGVYECQISTEPKMSLNVSLALVVAKARISEGSNLYIQSGNTINLTCVVTDSRAPPVYVFWYHDDRMINYDSARTAGIRVASERGHSTTVSRLQVPDATTGDSGNYSCIPSYADPAYITVHVLNGEKPAAMQHGRQGNLSERSRSSLHLVTGALMLYRVIHVVVLK